MFSATLGGGGQPNSDILLTLADGVAETKSYFGWEKKWSKWFKSWTKPKDIVLFCSDEGSKN